MKQIFLRRISYYSDRTFISQVSQHKIIYQSEFPVFSGETEHSYFDVTESVDTEDYFDFIYKRGKSVE